MRILVVDDSESVRLLFEAYLKGAGYNDLLSAESARDAFKLLGMDNPTSGEVGVDLILMDITMPETDGIEACRRIKSVTRLRDIPIIMVTALGEMKYLDDAFAAGATDYVTKSVTKVDLLARVRSALVLKREMDARKVAYDELEDAYTQLEGHNRELQEALTKVILQKEL